jgi:bilirubin oxidase
MNKVILGILAVVSIQFAQAQNQLFIPGTLAGPTFDLTVAYDSVEFIPGYLTQTAGVNGPILGPTLIINKGDAVSINVTNELSDTTTMHWHGVHLPSEMDGGPHSKIAPNTTWSPNWIAMDNASTMWYHPHLHHTTYKQVMMGVSGIIINRDSAESALVLPRTYGVDDIPLVLQTKVMTADHQIDTDLGHRNMDTMLLVNATRNAYFNAPAQLVRFRILNGSAMRSFNVGLSNGADFWVIGSDGGLLSAPVQVNDLVVSNGERYEIIVDLSGLEGSSVELMNLGTTIPSGVYGSATMGGMGGSSIPNYSNNPLNGSDFTLLTLNVGEPTLNSITSMPTELVTIDLLSEFNVDENRNLEMSAVDMGMNAALNGPFQINNSPFDMTVINEVVRINNKEVWTVNNLTQIAHPFHIHDVQFNIIEVNGDTPPAHMQGWKDVVLVPGQMGSAKFITKFEDFTDPEIPFMYHCHILAHEDEGMMGQFIVVEEDFDLPLIENSIFSFYPNPVSDLLIIELVNKSTETLRIYDITGSVVYEQEITNKNTDIGLTSLSKGIYLLAVGDEMERFIKY